jgi:16S rRNA (cytosine1402-N4)-methyltransferase
LAPLVEGPQVAPDFVHEPVLAAEVVNALAASDGIIIDATLGGAGHSALILDRYPGVRVIGIDRDPIARDAARRRLAPFGDRAVVVAGDFASMATLVAPLTHGEPIRGVLMDLGVSSPQLDDGSRGFSFRADAPLDMRMDTTQGETAAEFVARVDAGILTELFKEHGESRFAGAIARSVSAARPTTTSELVAAVERAVPAAARRRGHVATRVFQALRVAVNQEDEQLREGLAAAQALLAPGGVLVVMSYHSGEDKVVKKFMLEGESGGCTCPAQLPCVCGAVPIFDTMRHGAILASTEEVERNPRARSARLRIARMKEAS